MNGFGKTPTNDSISRKQRRIRLFLAHERSRKNRIERDQRRKHNAKNRSSK
jgi:hypothetical protein